MRSYRDIVSRSPRELSCQVSLGVDEALMIQRNEMERTLALLRAKRNRT